jgi:NAD-dependent deacetylase
VFNQLQQTLLSSKSTVVFTGAGVSTLSGIRDFRGQGGFYTSDYHGFEVEELLSLPLFYRDPSHFYRWAGEFIYVLDDFEPSIVHTTLAAMEHKGLISALYTQNIDLLHQKGGSKDVYEIHGSPANHTCPSCAKHYSYGEVAPLVQQGQVPTCSCGAVIKPDIVFYGESLNQNLLLQAEKDFAQADVALVLGSSLTVQPAASLPLSTVYNKGKLIIVNAQPTPLDSHAFLVFRDLKSVFVELQQMVV